VSSPNPRERNFTVTVEVPSNIALVKYWGKRDPERQWPANDSLSMTLNAAKTITTARVGNGAGLDSLRREDQNGKLVAVDQGDKALRHLAFLRRELGMEGALELTTRNTFPTGCGIASSASGLGALTLAAIAAWTQASTLGELASAGFDRERLAALARLGSGSACRSFHGGYVMWGAGSEPDRQTVMQVHDSDHWQLADLICIVSREEKAISSSAGHLTAATSPLYRPRLAGLPERMRRVRAALAARDLDALGTQIEAEALEMHSVMMTATPSLRYLQDASCELLTWLRSERESRGLPAYFTIDAGPNIHVICSQKDSDKVASRILAAFPKVSIINDSTGGGPSMTGRHLA